MKTTYFYSLTILLLLTIFSASPVINFGTCVGLLQKRDPIYTEMLEKALELHPELIHKENKYGDTLLHEAAFYCRVKAIEVLVKAGADLNAINQAGKTPLHKTISKKRCGNIETNERCKLICLLLQFGADPNIANIRGRTPLHYAAFYQQTAFIKTLLENLRTKNDLRDIDGQTPLDIAFKKNPDVAHSLRSDQQTQKRMISAKCTELTTRYGSYGALLLEENGNASE